MFLLQVVSERACSLLQCAYRGILTDTMEPTAPRYQHLGFRAFWMFLFMRGKFAMITAVLLIILATAAGNIKNLTPAFGLLLLQAVEILLLLFFISLVGAFLVALFQYIAYQFMLDEHALKIKSGIINIQVEAIPYRQMQNIDIERDLLYRIMGISRLVILTSATEDPDTSNESEAVIPAIDKNLGYMIQEELLKRANVERVTFDKHEKF